MYSKRNQILNLIEELEVSIFLIKIDPKTFNEEELKLIEKGGYSLSEIDPDSSSLKDSLASSIDYKDTKKIDVKKSSMKNSTVKPKNFQNHQMENLKSVSIILNKKYGNVISQQERQLNFLHSEINRIKKANELEVTRIQNLSQKQKDQHDTEMKRIKASLINQQDQNGLLVESLQQIKDVLTGSIPEVTYLRLKEIPKHDLLPNEVVLIELWQTLAPFRNSMDNSRREISSLREEIKILNEKQNLQLNELEHCNKLLIDKDEDYKRYSMNTENSKRTLELELKRAYDELALNREKIARFDELERTLKKFEQEKYLLEEKLSYYDANADSNSHQEIFRRREEMQRKIDLLSSDKEYIVKENIGLLEKNKRLEEKLDRLENELSETKAQNQDYLYQLLNNKNEFSRGYEDKVNKEISTLREKHAVPL